MDCMESCHWLVDPRIHRKGSSCEPTTPYNPAGNGLYGELSLACRSKNLPIKYWQDVLPDALLCTATNEKPYERLFRFTRRSTSGCSVPSWLTIPCPVYVKRHVRTCKTEPLVDEVELIGENSHYAHVRYPDGRETTVSTRHLAPCGEPTSLLLPSVPIQPGPSLEGEPDPHSVSTPDSSEMEGIPVLPSIPDPEVTLRQSERTRNPVDRLVLHF